MPTSSNSASLAVLIDADNTRPRFAQPIFDEIVTLGEANVRRILRRLLQRTAGRLERGDQVACHPSAPAAQQHQGQERV